MKNQMPSSKIPNLEFAKSNNTNDYQYLIRRLKSIKERINLLENNLLKN